MIKIGLIGLKQTGKDTLVRLADMYLEGTLKNTYSLVNLKLADGINSIIVDYFDLPEKISCTEMVKRHYPNFSFDKKQTLRDLQKFIGQGFREFDLNIWIKFCERQISTRERITAENSLPYFLFISDLRFPDEIEMAKKNGFILIDLNRTNHLVKEKAIVKFLGHNWLSRFVMFFVNRGLTHPSEWNYWKVKKQANYSIDFHCEKELISLFVMILKKQPEYISLEKKT